MEEAHFSHQKSEKHAPQTQCSERDRYGKVTQNNVRRAGIIASCFSTTKQTSLFWHDTAFRLSLACFNAAMYTSLCWNRRPDTVRAGTLLSFCQLM